MSGAKKTGRPPVVSDAVLAIVQAHPGEGLTCGRIARMAEVTQQAVRDALRSVRCAGLARLVRGRNPMVFADQVHCDAWVKAHPVIRRGTATAHRKTAEWQRLIIGAVNAAPGSSAATIAEMIGCGVANCRRNVGELERSGEVWRAGPATKLVWFASAESRDAAIAGIEAKEAARREEIRKHKESAGKKRSAQKPKFSIAAKGVQDKAVVERIRAAKAPPKIIGMETAKRTICPPCDVERYRVAGPVVGGWATLGVGRYLESQ